MDHLPSRTIERQSAGGPRLRRRSSRGELVCAGLHAIGVAAFRRFRGARRGVGTTVATRQDARSGRRCRGQTMSDSLSKGLGPNAKFIGVEGARRWLSTPGLLLDIDALDRNIAAMASRARVHGVGLRPHSKGAKSIAIARRQMAAGAWASAARRSAKQRLWRAADSAICSSRRPS